MLLSALMLASAAPAALAPGFAAQADAYLARAYPADQPGAVVIVTSGGKPVYRAALGLADRATGRKTGFDTRFRYGSISKPFAAATLMKYVERGRIGLDDPLSKWLPAYPQPGAGATVRQLLNHTSGIASYTAIPGWMERHATHALDTDQMIATFRDAPADFAPGSGWRYNNSGYVLVGKLIEVLSGKRWDEAVLDEVVRPLGLQTIRHGAGEAEVATMARGYGRNGDEVVDAPAIHMNITGPAGALIGTADDLARWTHAFHHGQVVSAASREAMTRASTLNDGTPQAYGLGFELDDLRGRRQIGHSGRTMGFATDSLYLPDSDLFVTVMTNSDNPTAVPVVVTRRLAAMALGDPFPDFVEQPLDPARAQALVGTYEAPDGARRIEFDSGKLWWTREGAAPRPLLAAGGDRYFFGADSLDYVDFAALDGGGMRADVHQRGAKAASAALRRGPAPASVAVVLSDAEMDRLSGDYSAPMGPVKVTREGAQLMFRLGDQPALAMSPQDGGKFLLRDVGATVEFTADGLVIHHGGQKVPAKRVR